MPKHEVEQSAAKAIRTRLLQVVADRHEGNQAQFGRAYNASHGALTQWFGKRPAPPSVPFLLALAKRDHVSLDGLLLGLGALYRWRMQKLAVRPGLAEQNLELKQEIKRLRQQLANLYRGVRTFLRGQRRESKGATARRKRSPQKPRGRRGQKGRTS